MSAALTREIALLEMKNKIESAAEKEMSDAQRQYFLRQQLKAIQDELGEGEKTETQDLRKRLAEAKLPETVASVADREVAQIAVVGSRELGALAELGLLERGDLGRAQLSSCSFLLRRYTNGNTLILLKGV